MRFRLSTLRPHKPTLTEKNLPDQTGKVFIVTGASAGVGKELAGILYQRNAKVYVATRSEAKAKAAMEDIQKRHPDSSGQLLFLHLQLDDLTTIKKSANKFLAQESRLDVLWNNAGVMVPPQGSKTVQGYELQLGVNVLGHFLFTHFLHPILAKTAQTAPKNAVRIIWVSSSAADAAPTPAIDFSNLDYHRDESASVKYCRSKAGNVLHSVEFSRRTAGEGILSLALNPGNLTTDLQRSMPLWQQFLLKPILYPAINGAYTELFAGLDSSITEENQGGWVCPFGSVEEIRRDLEEPELCKKFWEWSETQVKPYI